MKGKLIVVWNPIINRMGSSSLALNIGTVLSWTAFKKVHITNLSETNNIEMYFKNDMLVQHTLDHLKILRENINAENIKMYSTFINDKLNIIGGYQLDKGLIKGSEDFSLKYLEEALNIHDYVIVDLSNKKEWKLLDRADLIISLMPMDNFMFEESISDELWHYIRSEKGIVVFNNLPLGLEKEVENFSKEHSLQASCYLPSDPNIHYYTCMKNNIYSYIVENLKEKRNKDRYINQLQELIYLILMKEDEELYSIGRKKIFSSFRRTS